MGAIIGVVIGLQPRDADGAEGWAEFSEACKTIASSEEVRDLVAGGLSMARDFSVVGTRLLAEVLNGTMPAVAKLRRAA